MGGRAYTEKSNHLLGMVMEAKNLRRWLYTPIIFWRSVIISLGIGKPTLLGTHISPPKVNYMGLYSQWCLNHLLQNHLVGGWTNPFEKYARQNWESWNPNFRGENEQKYLRKTTNQSLYTHKLDLSLHPFTLPPNRFLAVSFRPPIISTTVDSGDFGGEGVDLPLQWRPQMLPPGMERFYHVGNCPKMSQMS